MPRVRNSKGQAIVEFVILVPLLLGIACIVLELGNMVFVAHRLSSATREGARIATETSLPAPRDANALPTCNLSECAQANSICCIAVNRANLVLFNSGIQGADINGRWFLENANGRTYSMFEIEATLDTNFILSWVFQAFGNTANNLTLRSTSVAYGDDF